MNEAFEIRTRAAYIQDRMAAACMRVGRSPDEVTLVAVTKTFSARTVVSAVDAGLVDFGENRVQELSQKAGDVEGLVGGRSVRWHMIGHLQRNKARDVVEVATLFHGLDSVRLAAELDRRAAGFGRRLSCLIQVNTSGESSKAGVPPHEVEALVEEVLDYEWISVRGLMTIAAPVENAEGVRHEFRELRQIRDRLASSYPRSSLDHLSMGMSGDFEVAVEEGATHVRIGSAIFGQRDA